MRLLKPQVISSPPLLLLLFNHISRNATFPTTWCIGLIISLVKSGEDDDPNNYRGITINICLSKLFMLLFSDRMNKLCESKSMISYNQIGFRKGSRPADHIFILKTMIYQAISQKKTLHTCFADFMKAYDTIWRDGLITNYLSKGTLWFVNISI